MILYKDDNTFLYEWIKYLNDNIIATSSTEFHVNDRWSDRTEKDDAIGQNGLTSHFW